MSGKFIFAAVLAVVPAAAQVNLSGEWAARQHEDQLERGPGPELGDYLEIPVNDAARLRADSWDPSRITLPEEQCRVHLSTYIYRGPMALRENAFCSTRPLQAPDDRFPR